MTIVEDTSIDNFVQKIGISKFCFRWQKAHIMVSEEKREANKQNCFLSINSMVDTSYHHHLILKFLKSGFCVKHIVVAIDAFLQENFCVAHWPIIYLTIVLHRLSHHVMSHHHCHRHLDGDLNVLLAEVGDVHVGDNLLPPLLLLRTLYPASLCHVTSMLAMTCLSLIFPPLKEACTQSQHKTNSKRTGALEEVWAPRCPRRDWSSNVGVDRLGGRGHH